MIKSFIIIITTVWLSFASSAVADELAVGRFSADGLRGWETKSFKGLTDYRLVRENDKMVIKATSHAAASGLVRKISFDPQKFRYLHWSWRIVHTIPEGDEKTKTGDDYAARLYVVFSGRYFWQTKAINYIWANHLKTGDSIPNAYTSNAIMVAVESGNDKAGQWLVEERDIFSDYRRLFGSDPGQASAIAIMTDTDNTGSDATTWYDDITLSTNR
ncbi:MAG: DUF3047 domain-containing protein [Desulfuromonadales bacterium]|nr:DUF3047 domain-containing protein [Desulfuromonadales bacterium]